MSLKRKWLRAIFLAMLAISCAFGVNPKEIEDLLHTMNETKVEFTIPDRDAHGDGDPDGYKPLIEFGGEEPETRTWTE